MKVLKLLGLVAVVFLFTAGSAMAQNTVPSTSILSGRGMGFGLAMALTIVGAAYGFGKIGSAALESMARQPEVAPRIQTAMIIIAAMLEGATLASVILCYLVGTGSNY